MLEVVKTIYRNGAFFPQTPVNLPEETEVEIVIEKQEATTSISEEEREKLMSQLLENMKNNPIPQDAPCKFNREELYERR